MPSSNAENFSTLHRYRVVCYDHYRFVGGDHIDPWATPVVAVESSNGAATGVGKGTAKGTAKGTTKGTAKGTAKGARDVVLPRTISRPWLKLDGSQNRSLLKRFDHGAAWVVGGVG